MRSWCCLLFVSCLFWCHPSCHASDNGEDFSHPFEWYPDYHLNITEMYPDIYEGLNMSHVGEEESTTLVMSKMALRRESIKFYFRMDSYDSYTALDLSNNLLTSFEFEDFLETKFPNIESLNLKRNRLTRLPLLRKCANLTELNLNYNGGLVIRSGDVIKYLPSSIEVLRLKHTATQLFLSDSLGSLPNLRILILSDGEKEGRRNRQFLPGSLDNLSLLEELDISRSHWTSDTIERQELFRQMTSLRIFKAERCSLRSIRMLRSQLPFVEKLETLWLSGNSRMRDASWILSSTNFSRLTSLHLSSVPLNRMSDSSTVFQNMESLQDLDIRKTLIREKDVNNLRSLIRLRTLDLRDNRLTKIPPLPLTLRNLHFTGNRVKHITRSSIPSQLRQLDLSNQGIVTIDDDAFYHYEETDVNQITKLNLSGNHLQLLTPHTLHGLVSLTTLDIGRNRLRRLESISEDVSRLNTLILSMNQITYISRNVFDNLPDLEYLDLSHNFLQHLDAALPFLETLHLYNNSFGTLGNITQQSVFSELLHVNLNSNQFTSLPPHAFDRCFPKLETLRMDENLNLSSIDPLAFRNMTSLWSISMSCKDGQLELDSFQSFAEVEHLTELKLSGNSITSFVDVPLTNLQHLLLKRNRITMLAGPDPISHLLPSLRILNLKDNTISYVQPGILDGMDNLQMADLKKNPIRCPCDMNENQTNKLDELTRAKSFDYLRDWIRSSAKNASNPRWLAELVADEQVPTAEFADCMFETDIAAATQLILGLLTETSSSNPTCIQIFQNMHTDFDELLGSSGMGELNLGYLSNVYGSAAEPTIELPFGTEN